MRRALLGGLLCIALWSPGSAGAVTYAPVNQPGPALSVPQQLLDASLVCSANVAGATRAPVLLVVGTGATPKDNWSWNYIPAFNATGVPWCTLESPEHANGDIQVNGEYVVNAIRTMYARAGRKIAIIGHSQGGMVPRWALRFWPDTRAMVDDVISFAASNHGTTLAALTCSSSCSAADWQQRNDSNFIAAVNSLQETFAGISYTSVYTHTDEIVQPNNDSNGSSSLHGGGGVIANIATQEVCPGDLYEHLAIGTIDPVAYALAIDALGRAGPADKTQIDPLTCAQALMPGVNPATFLTDASTAAANLATSPATKISGEPPLRCYVLASCPAAASAATTAKAKKCSKRKKHRRHHHKKRCRRHKHKRHHRSGQ